jgi:hypothetical protein
MEDRGAPCAALSRRRSQLSPEPQVCVSGIDNAARVQNGYARLGTGGHPRPPRELKNL